MKKMLQFGVTLMCLLVVTLMLLGQSTLAFYSTSGRTTNIVTTGDISLAIHEMQSDGTPFPANGVYVSPGKRVSKIGTVENTSGHPFYLRMKVTDRVNDPVLLSAGILELDIKDEFWTLVDGYYYYNRILQPGETTEPLFTEVHIIGSKVDNSFIGKTFTLTVSASAVQSENNSADYVWDVLGWPDVA